MSRDPGGPIHALLIHDPSSSESPLGQKLAAAAGDRLRLQQANGLAKGLQRLAAGGVDVVLLPLSLAEEEGQQLELLRETSPTVPIVVLTGAEHEDRAAGAVRRGAQNYLVDDLVSGPLLLSTCRSAVERKQATEALRRSEARFRSTFESAALGMAIGDREGRFIETNASLRDMLGYTHDELRQKDFTELTHPDDVDTDLFLFKELVAGERRHYNLEKRYLRNDGSVVWGRLNVSLLRDAGGEPQYVLATVEDITERKASEELLRRSEQRLHASQRMEAIGRLAGGIAHDFNNLLTAILGYSDLVLQELGEDSPLRADIEDIRRNGERAAALTRKLLAFGRRQSLRPHTLDLNDLIAKLSPALRQTLGEGIELVIQPSQDLGYVEADPRQIEELLSSLARNAGDAMPDGGKLTIETTTVELDDSYFQSGVEVKPGLYSVIVMSDTGCGMDKEAAAHAFEPFFTTKKKGIGTGLGLSTAYGIVKQSGGYIWLYSEPEVGTVVKIYFPRSKKTFQEQRTKPLSRSRSARASETILLVEDEDSVRTLASRLLKMEGYTVLQASNGAEGLRICEEHPERIDLVLTDLVMPELSGPQMVKRLKPSRRGVKVLYMSGYTEAASFSRAVEPGIPFLHKPFTARGLVEKVRGVLDESMEDEHG